jgi:hypothetical protein
LLAIAKEFEMPTQQAGDDNKSGNKPGFLLNLASGLLELLPGSVEYCTPGHRMGLGYKLLLDNLTREPNAYGQPAEAFQHEIARHDFAQIEEV